MDLKWTLYLIVEGEMGDIKKILNNPVWVSFKKYCNEFRSELEDKGMPGHRLEYFLTNLKGKEVNYSGEFLQDLSEAGFISVDAKKRILLSKEAQGLIFTSVKEVKTKSNVKTRNRKR